MRELFPGFYNRTEEELSKLWKEGIFVFDTNMLLHVYEYSPATRERFFETLSKLQERIWIPYQVAFEYQRRRMKVIIRQKDSYRSVSKHLDKSMQFLQDGLESYKKDKHAFINTEELIKRVNQEISATKAEIQKAGNKHPDYKTVDPFREKLDELFAGKVGNSYDKETREKKYEEAQYRLDNEIPPGFEDDGKGPIDRYGDIIVWFELIDYAKLQKKPLIFVTDDVKKDWWIPQEESYGSRRARPELTQEMYLETGMLFHMYEGYGFMDEAQRFLQLEAKPEVIEEIKEVGQQDTTELEQNSRFYRGALATSIAYRAEFAVEEWLNATYSQAKLLKGQSTPSDFMIIESDGKSTDVVVRYFKELYNVHKIINRTLSLFERQNHTFNNLMIFIVTNSVKDAIEAFQRIEQHVSIPEKISLIIGHIEPDNQFYFVAKLPEE